MKLSSLEHTAAASLALVITLAAVWGFATLGYPVPAVAAPGIAHSLNAPNHCRPG